MKVIETDNHFGFILLVHAFCAVLALFPQAVSHAFSPDAFEDDDTCSRANVIDMNQKFQLHNFHDAGDQDWVKFYGIEGILYYYIKTRNPGPNCNTVMDLYDAEGNQIEDFELTKTSWTGDGEEENIQLEWQRPKEGTYYLRVRQYNPDAFGAGTRYSLVLWDGYGPDIPGKLTGTIKDKGSGRLIPGAAVKLSSAAEGSTSLITSNGAYTRLLSPGTYKMTVIAVGYQVYSTTIKISNMQKLTKDIRLTPLPGKPSDLQITAVSGPASANRGDAIEVVSMVKNRGQGKAGAFKVGIYLAHGSPIRFGDDRSLGSGALAGLDAGKTIQQRTKVEIPMDVQPGTYYLGALADPGQTLKETKKDNNGLVSGKTITIQ